jgi:hypothetical protein
LLSAHIDLESENQLGIQRAFDRKPTARPGRGRSAAS